MALANASNGVDGGSPSGAAGGDLAGTYPNPSVFQGHLTDQAAPAAPASGTLVLQSFNQQGFSVPHVYDTQGNAIEVTRDNMFVARNVTGSSISRGSAVYISGTTGTVPQVSLAKADAAATMPCVGLMYDTTANNGYGRVLFIGDLERYDTSGFAAGDKLYVSATSAGALVNTAPATFPQFIGFVLASGVGNGVIYAHSANASSIGYGATAGGDLGGTYPNPKVAAITETSGPTSLVAGTIADGQFLKRVGSTLVSALAPVTSVFGRTGAVVATSGDYTAAQVTNAADKSSASNQVFTGQVNSNTGMRANAATVGIGYGVGAGSNTTVTQANAFTTGVTANTMSGVITVTSFSLATSTNMTVKLTNSSISGTGWVLAVSVNGSDAGTCVVQGDIFASGTGYITVRNVSGSTISANLVLNWALISISTS